MRWSGPNSNSNMLEGLPAISKFIGKTPVTTRKWILDHGLPATKLPNGVWLTHKGLILQWIYAGHQATLRSRVQYALEDDEILALADKMGVDREEVKKEMLKDNQDA
jgi:hypothetical protein|tara:strand:+ start:1102 stop:1422 length:321 start_codon:yes stop_codon:yes gene_type:complete